MTLESELRQLLDRFVADALAVVHKHVELAFDDARVDGESEAQPAKPKRDPAPATFDSVEVDALARKALALLHDNADRLDPLGRADIARALGVSPMLATAALKQLVDAKQIIRRGAGRGTSYAVTSRDAGAPDDASAAPAPATTLD